MNIYAVTGFALLSCAAAVILKKFGDSAGYLIPAAALICLIGSALTSASPIGDLIRSLGSDERFNRYYTVMMKAMGVAVLGESACDICKDCGENSISNGVEICTKISIIIIAVPLITDIMGLAEEFLSQ